MRFAPNTGRGPLTELTLTPTSAGMMRDVGLQFHNVQVAGMTSLVTVDPATLSGMPGVTLLSAVNLSTDALFDGLISLDFHFDPAMLPLGYTAGELRLFEYDPTTGLQDITTSLTLDGDVIRGTSDALETFAIGVVPEPGAASMALLGAVICLGIRVFPSRDNLRASRSNELLGEDSSPLVTGASIATLVAARLNYRGWRRGLHGRSRGGVEIA